MKVFYSDTFVLPLPPGHRFPIQKYRRLRERIAASELVPPVRLCAAPAATDAELLRAHTAAYLNKVKYGRLSDKEIRRIGFPWSPEMVERSRRSVGATLAAVRTALAEGIALQTAGGTHHASADAGQGFCVFNDAAVAARTLQVENGLRRILIVDCDVHQGNGTAAIFAGDPGVFTFSIHAQKNFPFRKVAGDLDVGLPDGSGDAAYLEALRAGLQTALARSRPEIVLYLAGADPFEGDKYGRLALTKPGLAQRDAFVFAETRGRGMPTAVAMAGGYAPNIEDIVDIQMQTVRAAVACWSA